MAWRASRFPDGEKRLPLYTPEHHQIIHIGSRITTYATKCSCASSDRSRTNFATARLSCVILSLHPGSGHMAENFPSANPVPSSLTNATRWTLIKSSYTASDGQGTLTNVCHRSTSWALQLLELAFRYCHRLKWMERCPRLFMPSFHSCIARFVLHDFADIDLSSCTSAAASPPSCDKTQTHRPDYEHVQQPQLLQYCESFTIFGIPAARPQLSPYVKK